MSKKTPKQQRYLCIHGHFYQPPRENPWTENIEYQHSALPYHDWNERITRECYGPNTRSRLHGEGGLILKLINNYEYMSFNFGPTLLSWLEYTHPWIYSQILAADRASRKRFRGHGNALAQVYNHIIMPLATRRDKITQIRWGLADFRHRFGRDAEGMWLAETAVDTETLDLMAREGIKFTILSPTQAQSVRPLPARKASMEHHKRASWKDVSGGKIDPTRPYRVLLDNSGIRSIDIFFYDGPLSRAIAYEKLLASGSELLARIRHIFESHRDGVRLVSVATDGESYGHHFKFGEMALSWLFQHVEKSQDIKLTNFGLFLERFPPEQEVKIIENSSWSCSHGVERWRTHCGCSVSQTPGWNQAWRTPLRDGLNWLGNELAAVFENRGGRLFEKPYKVRDDYIKLLLKPSDLERDTFLESRSLRPLSHKDKIEAFQLLESQRMSLYMFTSCGWFFDDISGLEAAQVLMYASRAIDLIKEWAEKDLEKGLTEFLICAKSNDPSDKDGKQIYRAMAALTRIDPSRATAHYALSSIMEDAKRDSSPFFRMINPLTQHRMEEQGQRVVIGDLEVMEERTSRKFNRTYLALRQSGKEIYCLVGKNFVQPKDRLIEKLPIALMESSAEDIERLYGMHVTGVSKFDLNDLIPDTRMSIIQSLAQDLNMTIKNAIKKNSDLIHNFLNALQVTGEPAPDFLAHLFELMFFDELTEHLSPDQQMDAIDWKSLYRQAHLSEFNPRVEQAKDPAAYCAWEARLTGHTLKKAAQEFLKRQMECLVKDPDEALMENIIKFMNLARDLNMEPDIWECQNIYYDHKNEKGFQKALLKDQSSGFLEVGRILGFLVEDK